VVRGALALGRVDRTDPEVDRRSFGDWLTAHGQDQRAIETVWDLIGIATLNAPAERASLALAATVFQLGLLESASAADIGWSLVPLQELHGDAASRALTAAGVTVRTRTKVRDVVPVGDGWTVDGVAFDDVVLAVPPAAAEALAPARAVELGPGWAEELGSTPIVNLHVIYDRVVLDEPFFAAVDSPLQWVFDRTRQAGLSRGQYIAVSLSAADDLIDTPVPELRDRLLPHLERLLRITDARVLEFFVTRERQATFRQRPGTAGLRAPARTALPGLYLAGAWTDTGWPATMEGAVRSGEAAVAALLERRPAERREAVV
jgi:squalene-associated FAD-dependent desaturase